MEAGANFQEARDGAANVHAALGRAGDTAQDLQQRRFSGAVGADDADPFALRDLELDILQRPEFGRKATCGFRPFQRPRRVVLLAGEARKLAAEQVAQRAFPGRGGLVDHVALAEPGGADGVAHEWMSGRCSDDIGERRFETAEQADPKHQRCCGESHSDQDRRWIDQVGGAEMHQR